MNEFVVAPLDDCISLLEECGFEIKGVNIEHSRAYKSKVRIDVVARLPNGEERIHRIVYLVHPDQDRAALLWETAERQDNPLVDQVEAVVRFRFGPRPPSLRD